jgi:hypothetical protein
MMDTHVDKFKVTVEGFEPHLSVQSFELDLAINKIPVIQLNVLPIERVEPGSGHYITASAPKIQDLTGLYSRLLRMTLSQDAKATIKIDIETFGEKGNTDEQSQSVTLKDWILTDVGLSTVTAISAPVLTVVFSHPAVMLDKTGFVYERISNSMLMSKIYKETGGSDLIEYMDALYPKFADGEEIVYCEIASHGDGGPEDEYRQKVQEIRGKLSEHTPGKYIEGNMGGMLFLENVDEELTDNIKEAIGPIVAPLGFSGSTWRRLVSQICPAVFTNIVPTYDRPRLLMEPISPWQECSYKVNTPVANGIDMVSIDPSPIIGVASEKDYAEVLRVVNDHVRSQAEADDEDFSYAFYFPKRALQDNANGEILGVGRNGVVADILATDRNANAEENIDAPIGENLQDAGNGIQDERTMTIDEAYVQAMFQLHYRKNCAASVTTIPILKDEGAKMIYPGRVMTVFDKTSGAKLFYGFITTMIVRGSTEAADRLR